MQIKRIYVERKDNGLANALKNELENVLNIAAQGMRVFLRYDIEGIEDADFEKAVRLVFGCPPSDTVYYEYLPENVSGEVFAAELLPGQFDQRAESAADCVRLLTGGSRPLVRCANVYCISGVSSEQLIRIKQYIINPVESRLADMEKPATLISAQPEPEGVIMLDGFITAPLEQLRDILARYSLAMSLDDLIFVQAHFKSERRNPTLTELRVIDTYWSDHCRHTTFLTHLKSIKIAGRNPHIERAYKKYLELFNKHHGGRIDKYPSLMDMATIGVKELRARGRCQAMDISPEINACSIEVPAVVDGEPTDYLVMFKNETHNHPTEIEPFGGAATCLGGAIRDPLSGRSYVYQAMRISGAGDINAPFSKTLKGKLPQRVISKTAAKGFSSYGNQIGLATGMVREFYHPGYVAKRLEAGFVVGAAPKETVVRSAPEAGDIVLLIGGATGRDGCGGATGSSKAHDKKSLDVCGAEVQKGNAPEERKLQRLFRNPAVKKLIKRCNDFGAGGVSVAVGELAAGLDIHLDAVPKKYTGLSATELAISESQERMAVVIAASDLNKMRALCNEENIDMTHIATVTDTDSMRMYYKSTLIVDLKRKFLDSNGVRQSADAVISDGYAHSLFDLNKKRRALYNKKDYGALICDILSDPNVCSQKGLSEMFDSTIGAGSVLMPFGGKKYLTPAISMAAKLPTNGLTDTCTVAACGFDPELSESSPFMGALYAVTLSFIKTAVTGVRPENIYLSLQEFFGKCRDAKKWGKPASAMLGALTAQLELGAGAIGGKDSMSGSFENMDVPPTLISFALGAGDARHIISNVLDMPDRAVYRYRLKRDRFGFFDFENLNEFLKLLFGEIVRGNVRYASVAETGGAAAAVIKSCLGNGLGFVFNGSRQDYFTNSQGDILLTVASPDDFIGYGLELLGVTSSRPEIVFDAHIQEEGKQTFKITGGKVVGLEQALKAFTDTFEGIYPTVCKNNGETKDIFYNERSEIGPAKKSKKPKVLIPVFPGTNCEYDSAKRFEIAGGQVNTFIVKNRTPQDITDSVDAIVKAVKESHIIMFPGGFSGGDEPDGSAKLIASFFSHPKIKDAVNDFLEVKRGLILGICNGFQALVKLGLLPFGRFADIREESPVLTFNDIGRHVSQLVNIRVSSVLSPWLSQTQAGQVYVNAVSHGEGKFVCTDEMLKQLIANNQIATQYADNKGFATMTAPFNPNGSMYSIEGITSADGRILGKMGHSERIGLNLMKNAVSDYSQTDMQIFEAGIKYFK